MGYWTEFPQIPTDVEEPLAFNLINSEFRSCNLFRNATVPNKSGIDQLCKFGSELFSTTTSLE